MTNKLLARAAVASLILSMTLGPAEAAAQKAALAGDSSFIQTVGSIGLLQVKLGKLAQEKASSPSVKEFANRTVAEYTKANEKLAGAAKQAGFATPVLLRTHQQVFDLFSNTSRSAFDKKFMAEVVKQESEAVRLFQEEAEGGRIASLKQLASAMLPTVQQHLSLARETASSVGADVTASASRQRQGS